MPEKEAEKEIRDVWEKLVEEAQNAVTNLTFVEPITSKKVSDVFPAIARIYARSTDSTGEALGGG